MILRNLEKGPVLNYEEKRGGELRRPFQKNLKEKKRRKYLLLYSRDLRKKEERMVLRKL